MYRITVTRIQETTAETSATPVAAVSETEIFRQVVENFDLGKFAVALNKPTRARKTKAPKSGN